MTAGAQDLASLEQMRRSAEQGNADAQLEMGILYEFGYNMPKNDINALAWYMHAADQGSELAIKRRDLLKSHMTPEEVDAAQKLYSEVVAGKAEKTEKTETPAPAGMKPDASETVQPTQPPAEMPPTPGMENPPAAEQKPEDMAPTEPVTDGSQPSTEKPSSPP